jgi:hypothetical protein
LGRKVKNHFILLTIFCIFTLILCGTTTAANPANLNVNPSGNELNSYLNYESSSSSVIKNSTLTSKSSEVLRVNNGNKQTTASSNQKSKVYLIKIQSTGFKSNQVVFDKFNIYQKPANNAKWCKYLFNRIVTDANPGVKGPEDNYRICKLQNVDLTKANPSYFPNMTDLNVEDLTTTGNWEKAVQIRSNQDPLIGGMHGYEKHVSIKYFTDNLEVTPSVKHVLQCDELKIIVVSNLLDPADGKTVIAVTTCQYLWNGQELLLNTTIKWKVSETVYTAYAAMFPVKRDDHVSTIGQIDGLAEETLTLNRTTILRGDSAKGTTWNYINNLKLSLEVLNPQIALENYAYNGDSFNGKTYFNNIGTYNKLYITRVHSPYTESVNNTTVWTIESRYKIWNDYTVPLTVISTDPHTKAINVAANKIIKITFRNPIKAGINYNKILLYKNGKIIPITKTISGYTLSLHHSYLDTGTEYKIFIPSGSINDLTGQKLLKDFKFSFITDKIPPILISIDPRWNAVNVKVDRNIKVLFNEPIKFGTSYILLKDIHGKYIPTYRSISRNLLTINPTINLAKGIRYTLILQAGSIKDISGNKISRLYTSPFRTDKPPILKAVDPHNYAVNVKVDRNIKVLFNEPIKFGTNYITLRDSHGKYIPTNRNIIKNLLIINPRINLAKGTKYVLILYTRCIKDLNGYGLNQSYIIRFTTKK